MSCKTCNTICVEQGTDHEMCMAWTKKPKTNADRIRAMTDDELLSFIYGVQVDAYSKGLIEFPIKDYPTTIIDWRNWLKQEVSDG